MNHHIPATLSALALALITAFPSAAQTAPAAPAAPASAPDKPTQELQRVEIFGQAAKPYTVKDASAGTKTDTPIMQTPLSIQTVPQQVLQDQNATILDQALTNVSGVKSSNGTGLQESIYLRGFMTTTTFRNGFRIDDSLGNGLRTLTNVNSIEVLKGPAAILYGRVEPGGVVNLVTEQPQIAPYYLLEQQIGSWNHYLTNLDATGPVNKDKTVLYRINASYDQSNSWRDSVRNEKLFVAPTLQWRLSPQTQLTLEAEYTHNPFTYDAAQAVPYDTVSQQLVWLPRQQNLAASPPSVNDTTFLGLNGSHQFNNDWATKFQIMQNKVTSKYDPFYYVTGFTQESSSSWTVGRGRSYGDGNDTTTAAIVDMTGHFDTGGLKHTLLIGADYYRKKLNLSYGYSNDVSTTDAFNPTAPAGLVIDPATLTATRSSTDNYGAYVQDQIAMPHEVFVLAGLRYQKVTGTSSSIDALGTTAPDDPQSDHGVTPRLGILWQPQGWLSVYGNYTENFGANTGRGWDGTPLKPEGAQQFEVGVKTRLFDGKLGTSLAFFDLTKQNVATADLAHATDPACVISGCFIAIGEVRSKGMEFDAQGEVQPGLNVIATYTYTDIKITKSNNGDEGLRMPNVPRNMASLWVAYDLKAEPLLGWKIGGGLVYRGQATDSTNTINTPRYTLVNAMAAYEFKAGPSRATAQININNLFNKSYYADAAVYGTDAYLTCGTPRSITASIRFDF